MGASPSSIEMRTFKCEVSEDQTGGPEFKITTPDRPTWSFVSDSVEGCLEHIKSAKILPWEIAMTAAEFFGFGSPNIRKEIEDLDSCQECTKYWSVRSLKGCFSKPSNAPSTSYGCPAQVGVVPPRAIEPVSVLDSGAMEGEGGVGGKVDDKKVRRGGGSVFNLRQASGHGLTLPLLNMFETSRKDHLEALATYLTPCGDQSVKTLVQVMRSVLKDAK